MTEPRSPLSPREWEILAAIADGGTNEEIARALGISPNTIKTHIRRCYRKLGVSTRAAALAWYAEHLPDVLGEAVD